MTVRFAVGPGFDTIAECEAWADRGAQGEREVAQAIARLTLVSDYGMVEAQIDEWSPPHLFLYEFGRLSLIYAAKAKSRGGADATALLVCSMKDARSAAPFETEALRRLRELGI